MKNYLTLLLLLISFSKALACSCDGSFQFETLDDLKRYEFIAHVKITNDHDKEESNETNEYSTFDKLDIQVLELFKGKIMHEIYEVDKNTSCGMGISNGEEWIFFAYRRNDKLVVSYCDLNEIYRQSDGRRDWEYERGFTEIKKLRAIFGIPERKYSNEKHVEYYTNGQIEIEETFINEKREGEQKIWYPNGVLTSKKFFVNDSLDGKIVQHYPSGQIESVSFFQRGKPYNVHRRYNDTTDHHVFWLKSDEEYELVKDSLLKEYKRISLSLERVYNAKGENIVQRMYDRMGKLHTEIIFHPETKVYTYVNYHASEHGGLISSIEYIQPLGQKFFGHYQTYNYDGLPYDSWDYDILGNQINVKLAPRMKTSN